MHTRRHTLTLAAVLLLAAAAVAYLAAGARPNLGLDLQGGISAIYTPVLPDGAEPTDDELTEALDETIEVIRGRIDSLGIAEPAISRQGTNVLVQLPGVADAERMQTIIGTTARLTFRPVDQVIFPGQPGYDDGPDCLAAADQQPDLPDDQPGILCGTPRPIGDELTDDVVVAEPEKYQLRPAAVLGEQIRDATVTISQTGGNYSVGLTLDRTGAAAFQQISSELACERDQGLPGQFAIVLDGTVDTAPTMNPDVRCGTGIVGGQATITVGGDTADDQRAEAEDLALLLRTGALPLTLEPATFETVSATLGGAALRTGLLAGLIGLALVGVWLVGFYRWMGLVALGEIVVFAVLLSGLTTVLGHAGFALTLAGIAGIVVSVGMTADSAIIFTERVRDEIRAGRTVRSAVPRAHAAAWKTNLAGNTVTIVAAAVLYWLAVGPVRGFALMLGIANVLDLLLMHFFARPAALLLTNTKRLTARSVRAHVPPVPGEVR